MARESSGCAYVDGAYVGLEQATISVFDWGLLHSDATYDVAHAWKGRFFRLDDHLDRFERNLTALRLDTGLSRAQIREVLHECVRRSDLRDAYVEVVCTRGRPAPGSRDPRTCTNRFLAFAIPFVWVADPERQRQGVNLIVADRQRIAEASVDPRIKNYHWLDFTLGLFDAYDRGGETVVLTDPDGCVAEGPGFNVFAVFDADTRPRLVTPARGVLDGVTRRTVLELAETAGLDVEVRALPVDEFRTADEIFLTSTAGGVMAVHALDGVPISTSGDADIAPVTAGLQRVYWLMHEDPKFSEAVRYDV